VITLIFFNLRDIYLCLICESKLNLSCVAKLIFSQSVVTRLDHCTVKETLNHDVIVVLGLCTAIRKNCLFLACVHPLGRRDSPCARFGLCVGTRSSWTHWTGFSIVRSFYRTYFRILVYFFISEGSNVPYFSWVMYFTLVLVCLNFFISIWSIDQCLLKGPRLFGALTHEMLRFESGYEQI